MLSAHWGNRSGLNYLGSHWYLFEPEEDHDFGKIINNSVMSFFLLYNLIFPLELPCQISLLQMIYSLGLLEGDATMVCEEQSEVDNIIGCSVKNVNVLDDFAKVNHIFCDKTGTLTKNELIFK